MRQRAGQLVLALVDVPQLAPGMTPASGFDDAAVFIELVVARERVGLQYPTPALEVACGVLTLWLAEYWNHTAGGAIASPFEPRCGRSSRT
jgi:hypothetical protein